MGTLRIIAGELKGRRVLVPPGARVRPSAERVREALFSILGASVAGARVLDAYSGSGALGFEALSRGASSLVLLESDRFAVRCLRENASRLGVAERCTILQGRVLELLAQGRAEGPFDLVLADPPYSLGQTAHLLSLAAQQLASTGQMVLERDRSSSPSDSEGRALTLVRTARYGRTCLDFYRKA